MTKEDGENFESSTKCQICDTTFVGGDDKKGGFCHSTWKYMSVECRSVSM